MKDNRDRLLVCIPELEVVSDGFHDMVVEAVSAAGSTEKEKEREKRQKRDR